VSAPSRDLAAFVALVAFAVGLFRVGMYASCGGLGEEPCKSDAAGMAVVGAFLVLVGLGTIIWALVEDHKEQVSSRQGERRSA
jgi:hypothetical protein